MAAASRMLTVFAFTLGMAGCHGGASDAPPDAGKKIVPAKPIPPASSSVVASTSASTLPPSAPPRIVAGVGEVPPWSPDPKLGACIIAPSTHTKIEGFAKGDDAMIGKGTADVAEIVRTTAGPCATARRDLARAFDDGGNVRLAAKAADEAARWFAAALRVRPAWGPARADLVRALAAMGKKPEALAEMAELSRGAKDEDASASAALVTLKKAPEVASIASDPTFDAAMAATTTPFFDGPIDDAARATEAAALLPIEFALAPGDPQKGTKFKKLNPAVRWLYSWRPASGVDLYVASIIDDPATIGKPRDVTVNFGGIAVYRLVDKKLTLLVARRTGIEPPLVGPAKDAAVAYEMRDLCGDLKGVLRWSGNAVSVQEQACVDI